MARGILFLTTMEHSSPKLFDRIVLDASPSSQHFAAAIGFFDGLHLGHQYLLSTLRAVANERGLGTLAVTFEEHPRRVLGHPSAPDLLTPRSVLPTLLREQGVQQCAFLHFTPQMASMTAQQFMAEVLHAQLQVRTLLIGYDHHFGRPTPGEGFEHYQDYGRSLGIEVLCADAFRLDVHPDEALPKVSSSSIRLLLQQGSVQQAALLLGRPYRLEGTVVLGRQNGRKIGFPTANLHLDVPHQLVPQLGVYATRTWIAGHPYNSMTNIGRRPTLNNGTDVSIETHVFDVDQNLYNQHISLDFIARLRDEHHFENLEALIAQLGRDEQQARQLLNSLF